MNCFMCDSRARIFCMCNNTHTLMCVNHFKNHAEGRSYHVLRDIEGYQNRKFIKFIKATICSITVHMISTISKQIQEQANELNLAQTNEQRMQVLLEINKN